MNIIFPILIFFVVLFFYIHIHYHYKTSNDLEVFLLENPTRDRLEEVCNYKQPFKFDFINEHILNIFNNEYLLKKYGQFDINIRKLYSYDDECELYLPLSLKKSNLLIDRDNNYITENNNDFINETGLVRYLQQNDILLKPPLLMNCYYDYIYGSNEKTPLRYSINCRNYIYVTNGEISVKLVCPNDTKYLDRIKDYDNFEFISKLDVWSLGEDTKIRVLDLNLKKGEILFIPAYWWCSVKFNGKASLINFQYRTYMNTIAILPDLCMNFFQRQNIRHKSLETVKNNNNFDDKNKNGENNENNDLKNTKQNTDSDDDDIEIADLQNIETDIKNDINEKKKNLEVHENLNLVD